ncbi:MAG: septum site-determining protein MinC [Syntrophobacteraceae bacterium]
MESEKATPLQIKANRDGLMLVPHSLASFQSIMEYVDNRLKTTKDFFSRSEMTLDLRGRPLASDEIAALFRLLLEKAKVQLMEVMLTEDVSFFLEPGKIAPPPKPRKPDLEAYAFEEDAAVVVRNTCRSGMRIESPGDCVVLGDVNPGAEILAVGDVIVFGNLRGIAHAGALGDRSAKIWALSIEPSQIRIADLVAVPGKGDRRGVKRYEIAEIQKNRIEVITM